MQNTFLNCFNSRNLKNTLHRCDRAMIYIFIAGSYFPWLEIEQLPQGTWASSMRWGVWVLAALGILYQQTFHEKYKRLEIIFYLFMGIGPCLPILTHVIHCRYFLTIFPNECVFSTTSPASVN